VDRNLTKEGEFSSVLPELPIKNLRGRNRWLLWGRRRFRVTADEEGDEKWDEVYKSKREKNLTEVAHRKTTGMWKSHGAKKTGKAVQQSWGGRESEESI